MKKNGCLMLAAFLAGIFLANLSDKQLMTSYGILNTYFLSQYSYRVINYDNLFCYILLERIKTAFMLFLLGKVLGQKWFQILMEAAASVLLGFLMAAAIANLGLKGIAITLTGLFPQWIFYLAALFLYMGFLQQDSYSAWGRSGAMRTASAHIGFIFLAVFLLLAGIVTESYVNPVILKNILKIF